MTKKVFQNVQPVLKGFDSTIVLKYTSDFWGTYSMSLNNLAVNFNDTLDDATPLWTANTTGGNLLRDNVAKR